MHCATFKVRQCLLSPTVDSAWQRDQPVEWLGYYDALILQRQFDSPSKLLVRIKAVKKKQWAPMTDTPS